MVRVVRADLLDAEDRVVTATPRARFAPWAGFVAGPLCWALHQQGLSDILHFNCHLGSPVKGMVSFVVLAAVLIASGIVSWRRRGAVQLTQFIAGMSALSAGLFLFAIALQTAATLILLGCGA
jgi:hypothetical protein